MSNEKNYYRVNIRSMANGYVVEHFYKIEKQGVNDIYNEYSEDEYVFVNWAGVQEFVKNNPLEVPKK